MMEGEIVFGVDTNIIHIDLQPFFHYHVSKDVVYESLKGRWCIAESKEHYGWFKESEGGDEGGLPLIFLTNEDVVVAPLNVELHEEGGIFHIINELRDE